MNERYFPRECSAMSESGKLPEQILELVANHYIGNNPPIPFTLRTFSRNGFSWKQDGYLKLDYAEKFPDAKQGSRTYAAARLQSRNAQKILFNVQCYSPTAVFVNGEQVFASDIMDELNSDRTAVFAADLHPGLNDIVIRNVCTTGGFGCLFRLDNARWTWQNFLAPFQEREGMMSFAFTVPFDKSNDPGVPAELGGSERSTGLEWLPGLCSGKAGNVWQSCFDSPVNVKAYARTSILAVCDGMYTVRGCSRVWADRVCHSTDEPVFLSRGLHSLLFEARSSQEGDWPQSPCVLDPAGKPAALELVPAVQGTPEQIMLVGPFRIDQEIDIQTLEQNCLLYDTINGKDYWRVPGDHLWVRPSFEQPLFGRWNYPVGVTLYGLLKTGTSLRRTDILDYAARHIMECVKYAEYALWDMEQYGFAAVNNQLSSLEMLDDCGSFGLALMYLYQTCASEEQKNLIRPVVDRLADYIQNHQERREDGAFYRKRIGTLSENSMWADDLFMSTPFLAYYTHCFQKDQAMDDIGNQFIQFRKYLWIPELSLMSHVYSFRKQAKTGVPWGRGNGWVLFSLSEDLKLISENHPLRPQMMQMFLDLSSGALRQQGENGLWHQVLDDPASFEEASCTSMFTYAFCTGIQNGWYGDMEDEYFKAVMKAWRGLCDRAVDHLGNVYGICQGSGYSFIRDYYRDQLKPITNDTHGIGIILLAGNAVHELMNS